MMEFKKKKRAEERARESQKTKEKVCADYAWKDLCEDSTKLKQLRVSELNKYLTHHGIHQHIKSPKNDKVKVIAMHWLLQMNPEGPDPLMLQTRLGERDGADKDPYKTVTAMKMSTAEVKAMIMIRTTMIPSTLGGKDVILAFIDDEEEVERPATTRSGRSTNGRSEIDFLTLKKSEEVPWNGQNLFFELTEVAATSVE